MRYALIFCAAVIVSGAAHAAPDSFQREATRICPTRNLAQLQPAEMLDLADTYRGTLSPKPRHRLDAILHKHGDEGSIGVCDGHNGASCDVKAYLAAFERLHLTESFVNSACKSGP